MSVPHDPVSVPALNLRAQYQSIRDEIEPVVRQVLESQMFVLGPEVASLEAEVAAYCTAAHAVGCASGTDALLLPLLALDIGPGDEVITSPYTFFATAGSIWLPSGRAGCTTKPGRRTFARDHQMVEHVDVGGTEPRQHGGGFEIVEEQLGAVGNLPKWETVRFHDVAIRYQPSVAA